MRYGSGTAHFDGDDLTDTERVQGDPRERELDGVDAILALAAEVIDEYGADPGDSRIERLARFIVGRLGVPLPSEVPAPHRVTCLLPQAPEGRQSQHFVLVPTPDYLEPDEARAFAAEILRVADSVENDSVH